MYLDFNDPQTAVSSHFISAKALGIIRLLLALYALTVWTVSMFYTATIGSIEWRRSLINLFYTTFLIYMISAAVHTMIYAFKTLPASSDSSVPPQTLKRTAFNTRFHFLVYTIFVCMHMGVPIAYWIFLHPYTRHRDKPVHFWLTLSCHGGDCLVMIMEIMLGRILLRWTDWFILLACSTVYISYDVVLHVVAGGWAYPMLDWSNGPIVLWFFAGIPVLFSACFLVVMGLHSLRERLGRRSSYQHYGNRRGETAKV